MAVVPLPTLAACREQLLATLHDFRGELRLHGPTVALSETVKSGLNDNDGLEARLATVLAAAWQAADDGCVVLADRGDLPVIEACLTAGIFQERLVLAHQNAADFVWGLYTGAGTAARLGEVRAHGSDVAGACADIARARGTVAAACVRVGKQPKGSGKAARRVLAAGALRRGSRLVVIPSMGQLERRPAACQQELDAMVAAVLEYGEESGYTLEPVPEEGHQISQHARVFRVDGHNPRPAEPALVHPDVPVLPNEAGVVAALRSAIMVPDDSLRVWVKHADNARLRLHLRPGCSGADQQQRRDNVEGELVCSHCKFAYTSGQPLGSMLLVEPPADGENDGPGPAAPPTPLRVEVRPVAPADDDAPAGAAPNLVLLAVGRGKKVHWSEECQHVRRGRSRGPAVVHEMNFEQLQSQRARFNGTCSACANKTGDRPVALRHIFQPQH
ncbi:hypothetical protein ABPG75_009522 [Micractinium tetrahymenae]